MASEGTPPGEPSPHTLHYFPFSIYCIMVRFAFHLGIKLNPETAPAVNVRLVDLHQQEHLLEEFLTVNPKGQVPTFTSPTLPSPLIDSYDISRWLCVQQPELIPQEHRLTIERLMSNLYAFHVHALTAVPEDNKDGFPNQAAAMLERSSISETHRRRLEIKSVFHDTSYGGTFDPNSVEDVEGQARGFCQDIASLKELSQGPGIYLFGDKPTILDAHATAFIARMMELGRDDIISSATAREYALSVMSTDEWLKTTSGRRTLWDVSMGPVRDLSPL